MHSFDFISRSLVEKRGGTSAESRKSVTWHAEETFAFLQKRSGATFDDYMVGADGAGIILFFWFCLSPPFCFDKHCAFITQVTNGFLLGKI